MYTVVKLSGKLYATEVNMNDSEGILDTIHSFASDGTPITFVEELDDIELDQSEINNIEIV